MQQSLREQCCSGEEALTAAHCLIAEVFHVDAMAGIFPDLQMLAVRRAEQVCKGLVVDLKKAALAPHSPLDFTLQSKNLSR